MALNANKFHSKSSSVLEIKLWDFIYSVTPVSCNIEKETSSDDIQYQFKRNLLIKECENYLIVLPMQLGCTLCQFTHSTLQSSRYQHYIDRKEKIELFIQSLKKEPFLAKESLLLLEKMKTFKGRLGKKFYYQCKEWLISLVSIEDREK